MMRIPYYGLGDYALSQQEELIEISSKALLSGNYFDTDIIASFEHSLALYTNRLHAISVASCTDALFFALKVLGVGQGDKVVLPSVSFIATLTPVLRAGCIPVFCDIDPSTGHVDKEHMKTLVASHEIRAAILVDLYGIPSDPDLISDLEENHHIPVIVDAAQSLGSSRQGGPAGSYGSMACVSFDPTKTIHAFGSGGALLSNDPGIADRVHRLRYHGRSENDYSEHGYNSRLSSMQSAVLQMQLSKMGEILEDRNTTAGRYLSCLQKKQSLSVIKAELCSCNYHKFVVIAKARERFSEYMMSQGIQCLIHYPKPLYGYSLLKDKVFVKEGISSADPFCATVISLPLHTFMQEEKIEYICNIIEQYPEPC